MYYCCITNTHGSVLTKILSCPVNTASGRETKQRAVSFGAIFHLFPFERSRGATFIVAGGQIPFPVLLTALNTCQLVCVSVNSGFPFRSSVVL